MRLWPDHSRDAMGVCHFGGSSKPSGTTTNTTTSAPWSGQIPDITQSLGNAQQLYNQGNFGAGGALAPNYYPGQVQAQQNAQQTAAGNQAFAQGMAGGGSALQAANQGVSNYANGSQVNADPGSATAAQFGSGAYVGGPAQGLMSQVAANAGRTGNDFATAFDGYASNALNNPGSQMQQATANGAMLTARNPYFQQMAATTLANTMPQIQSAYAGAGRDDSGLAARAASEGANDAIGGLAYQNYNQGLQNQLTAQQNIAGNYLQGQAQRSSDLNSAAAIANQTNQTQLGAAQDIGGLTTQQQQLQLQGAQQQSANYQAGVGNALKAGLVAPTIDQQAMAENANAQAYGNQLYNQQQANNSQAQAQYNYTQGQPLMALQNFNNLIQGNYGSSQQQSSPYYMNSTANTIGGIGGLVGIGNGLFGKQGLVSSLFG